MKKIALLVGLSLLIGTVSAAQPSPFERAKASFLQQFPLGESEEWASLENGYVVSFYDRASSRAVEMEFDHKGRWQETTLSIETDELSEEILAYVDSNFEQHYTTAYELRRRRRKQFYGLVVDTPTHIHTLLFRANGNLVEQYSEGVDGGK